MIKNFCCKSWQYVSYTFPWGDNGKAWWSQGHNWSRSQCSCIESHVQEDLVLGVNVLQSLSWNSQKLSLSFCFVNEFHWTQNTECIRTWTFDACFVYSLPPYRFPSSLGQVLIHHLPSTKMAAMMYSGLDLGHGDSWVRAQVTSWERPLGITSIPSPRKQNI